MSGERESVLLVDDEADALESLGELVESEGLRPLMAVNGAEALKILRAGARPALIVRDLKMPVLDGWGFCAELDQDESLRETEEETSFRVVLPAAASEEREATRGLEIV